MTSNGIESRIGRRFCSLNKQKRAGLVTFVTANDPDKETFVKILEGLPTAGADFIEVGVPFSDPMADGLSIQASSIRALKHGVSLSEILETVKKLREWDMDTPIILMGYFNPIYSYGVAEFAKDAAQAGVDGVIVVDLPPEEAAELNEQLTPNNIHMIFLAAPTTDRARLSRILQYATGFLYYVSVKGVTGTKVADEDSVIKAVERIKKQTDLPVAVGFGIKTPQHAAAIARCADAAVVGSAIVDIIADGIEGAASCDTIITTKVLDFVKQLAEAVRGARC